VRVRRLITGLALLAAACAPAAPLAPAARASGGGLMLGFNSIPTDSVWLGRSVAEGANVIRVGVQWADVAPSRRPAGFNPSDPSSPGYDWSSIDSQVRAISGQGLQVLLIITEAPSWAQAPHRPSNAPEGTWKPNPAQVAQFAKAAARRYDGRFPDPVQPGAALPRVRYWQAWNEPNLDQYLTPQWTPTHNGNFAAASPNVYRPLLNAFYGAVKGVNPSNFVLTAGMAPYGNPPGLSLPGIGNRVPPVTFDRVLFSKPAHLDALAQSIYAIKGPTWHALNAGDVAVPDVYKVNAALSAGERAGKVLPRGPKQIWVTELGWNSNPPSPGGVPVAQQARWYEQAMYVLWRQGVDAVLLLQLVDASPPIPKGSTAEQSGLFFASGGAKPSATAFQFPFVTDRLDRRHVRVWGRSPSGGRLVIERQSGGTWRTLATLSAGARGVFVKTIALRGAAVLRARIGSQASLSWSQSA
jgi:hypothetical protein